MRKRLLSLLVLASLLLSFCSQTENHPVYMGNEMSSGYDLGVTSSSGVVGWLTDKGGYMEAAYPAGQEWGSLFITVGKIKDLPKKPTVDLSGLKKLSFDLKSDSADFSVEVGMKDAMDLDDGTETKVAVQVTKEWKNYEIDLSEFKTADMKQIYILVEFIFAGANAQPLHFRNIQFK